METLKKLSEYANAAKKPTSYIRAFRAALFARRFRAIMLADKFKIAGSQKGKTREVEDYAILDTPEFRAWHDETAVTISSSVKGMPTFADLKSGKVSIEDAEKITQAFLEKKAKRNSAQNERAKSRRRVNEANT
jgi:hypothetical protein